MEKHFLNELFLNELFLNELFLNELFLNELLSLTYNSLQSSQPTYLRELFTIQPTRSTRSSSCLTLSQPPVTSHLMFSNRAISITAPRLWNDLPSELLTIPFLYLHNTSSSASSIR